ncbi:MAG: TatD family hydrolase [Porticoccaceae bacterium]
MSPLEIDVELIDIGLNLADVRFAADYVAVLYRARAAGVAAAILTGTSESGSHRVLALCEELAPEFPGMLSCTAGVHPHEARHWRAETYALLAELASAAEVVAIGETGLDFHRDISSRALQETAFVAQLELAAELKLPVFLHERDAHRRQFDILRAYRDTLKGGVIHCFTGDRESLFNYLDLDLHIGITGWVCDERRGLGLAQLVQHIPLDRMMLETDAPYLVPRNMSPKPKSNRNEPAYLPWVLRQVAAHRRESESVIAEATSHTARAFFRLPSLSPESRGSSA